ncbi:hypothetical protein [Acetobacter conturbans]|uniref:Uncharacterized protein n=1 Tax=Acetobacter conturbans TaxID=1737472 RepID=A0ABX0JZZ9_9PROT|nr:hypothetical protein [Acetobacter conturbans]NHN89042.1 hypothetical protein [Acetobacter conturbans]
MCLPLLRRLLPRHLCVCILVGGTLGAAACPALAASDAQDDPTGDWSGMLVTDKGTCPTQRESVLQVQANRLFFAPATGTLVLRGKPDKTSQRFHAQLVLKDMKGQPLPMVFDGHPEGDTIVGVFGTPNCRAHIVLTRPKGNAWKNFMGN